MEVTVVVSTYGSDTWKMMGDNAALNVDNAPVIRVHGNRTLAHARNEGLRQVTTEWVCFVDGDDALKPGYFKAMSRGTADVRQPMVDGWARVPMIPTCTAAHLPAGHTVERECLRYGNPLCIGAVVRTELVRAVGGFDYQWPVIEDYALWRAIAIRGASFEPIPDATYMARVIDNPTPRNRIGGRRLRAMTHAQIDYVLPWPSTTPPRMEPSTTVA